MKEIWKYELIAGRIEVPRNSSQLLTVQLQGCKICAWILVDPREKETEAREYEIIGTGQPFDPKGMRYVTTFQSDGYVWHVWEVEK